MWLMDVSPGKQKACWLLCLSSGVKRHSVSVFYVPTVPTLSSPLYRPGNGGPEGYSLSMAHSWLRGTLVPSKISDLLTLNICFYT